MNKKKYFFINPIDFIETMVYYIIVSVALAGQTPFQ